ncbi:MurR/RpiR family transcriptional regulator|uniref:Transcriptional regulator, RpiR family n=1 Tax=Dendrosporobacter quercicolus TaxID=146817 RepID=A0A1G9SLE6_9FIRM|nr:MurR/RpiR family transcriptional regulator [Dendrosporobacter quercicolus]NSL48682.1 MurR/RpiR family transcriptional regulator [Dendrosporobacter quercicolus DSM 1736]SDM36127.1 transcriptional regulator, RpiR family [Dendrosporobacter quercicolus]
MGGMENFDQLINKMTCVAEESATYKKIAMYIERNYLQIIFMTAGELADKLDISQGSVSRFFIALGYRGYSDFLRNLQHLVSERLTAPQRIRYSKQHRQEDNPLRTIIDVEIANFDELMNIMHGASYDMLVDMMASKKQLVLISARMSATILPYIVYILNKMRPDVMQITPDLPGWESLELKNPEKTNIIAVMFPRYPNALVKKCMALKNRGFHLCGVTDSRFSPVTSCCDSTIFVPVTVSSVFDIYSTPIAFFNLAMRDAAKKMPWLDQRMKFIEKIECENDVYYQKTY